MLDELSYLTLKSEQIDMFFRLIDQRYLRTSTIITTNLDTPAWYDLFQKKPLVDALLDRLQHHCVTIRINGPSLRSRASEVSAPNRLRRRTAAAKPTSSHVNGPASPKPHRPRK